MRSNSHPLLYTFRRCPYAIRARMAVFSAGISVQLHEVSLKTKPAAMLAASAKGTVPVLCLEDKVLDESLDIMLWALANNDPEDWYSTYPEPQKKSALELIRQAESDFKPWLDKYKYADRNPDHTSVYYRQGGERFLQKLEGLLGNKRYLLANRASLADIAIFPFVRQFAMVDSNWFDACEYSKTREWLNYWLGTALFKRVMQKTPKFHEPQN